MSTFWSCLFVSVYVHVQFLNERGGQRSCFIISFFCFQLLFFFFLSGGGGGGWAVGGGVGGLTKNQTNKFLII